MRFRNASTATKQKLGLIAAQQHSLENKLSGKPFRTGIPDFDQWFLDGIRKYEEKGAEFELIDTGMVKITWPGQEPILRTVKDFEREYEQKFFPSQKVQMNFEEGAGLSC